MEPISPFDHLPKDMVVDILYRLPIKMIVRCTSVCKSWDSFIKSPAFISAHKNKTLSTKETDDLNLLVVRWYSDGVFKYTLPFGIEQNMEEERQILFPSLVNKEALVFLNCNSLVCISDTECDIIYLWNPCIKKLVNLPKPSSDFATSATSRAKPFVCIGLGYDNKINDYKLLKITQFVSSIHTVLELYSIRSTTWKRVDGSSTFASRFLIDNNNCHGLCFASGSLHFTACRSLAVWRSLQGIRKAILRFDVYNEVLHEIMLPESLQCWVTRRLLKVVGFDGGSSIAVVDSIVDLGGMKWEVWAMRKYGVVESWTKLFKITGVTPRNILELRKNGKVFIEGFKNPYDFGKHLVSCDPEGQQFNLSTVRRRENSFVSSYAGSLALFDIRTNVIDTSCASRDTDGQILHQKDEGEKQDSYCRSWRYFEHDENQSEEGR